MTPETLQESMLKSSEARGLFDHARKAAHAYMDGVRERPVFPTEEALEGLRVFDEPLPEAPGTPSEIIGLLHTFGSPATVASTGGRYFGFVTGGALPVALAAKWLTDVWDQATPLYLLSPVASHLEDVCEKWLVDLLQLPAGTAAGFVTGASAATMVGLAAGRDELLRRLGWDAGARGLFGAPELRVIVSAEAHGSVAKALGLLGLGRDRVETVPTDSQGRMVAEQMPELDGRCLVVAQAGGVMTGSFDPLAKIGDRVRRANAWLHVDGAIGLWAAASGSKKALTRGMEMADSWAADAHKVLNAPYDSGIVLCRDRRALAYAHRASGSYLVFGEHRDGILYTPDMSRRARVVELWATMKVLGRSGVEALVDQLCGHAVRFGAELRGRGFRVLNDVVFNQVLVACERPEITTATLEHLQEARECWCGGATWEGEPVIRISVCSWVTTTADVDRSVAAFVAARDQARRGAEVGARLA